MENGEVDNHDDVMEKYRNLHYYLKDNNLTDLELSGDTFNLPEEFQFDKSLCKSWFGFDYMTVYNKTN